MTTPEYSPQHLVLVHYHLRPSGVRRVMELALPSVIAYMPTLKRVTFFVGEADDTVWVAALRAKLHGLSCIFEIHPSAGYFSEFDGDAASMRRDLKTELRRVIDPAEETILWAHNLGLARNLPLAQELALVARLPKVRLVSHHHDFWFENRWTRWPEFLECGMKTLDDVADCIFSRGARVAYSTINRQDFLAVSRFASASTAWLPNALNFDSDKPSSEAGEVRHARSWLELQFGMAAPVWVVPSRFLRRKNIAEAMLLMRWLCPEGWLITTAGPSSADEMTAYQKLTDFSNAERLRVRFGVLADPNADAPPIDALIAACDGVMVSSIQEGFGLPYLEAAAAGRPLIARNLPNVFQDFESLGFHPANTYPEIWIHPDLLDMEREKIRQNERWQNWTSILPFAARALTGAPWISTWQTGEPIAFSRLTLDAQMEILSTAPEISWQKSASLNPSLCQIQNRMQSGGLIPDPVPATLKVQLGVQNYARSFWDIAKSAAIHGERIPGKIQESMLASRLKSSCLFPVFW